MVARNLTTRRPVMVEMTRHVATSRTFEVTASAMLGGNPSPRQTATIGIIVRSFVSQPSFTRVTVLPDGAIEVFDNPAQIGRYAVLPARVVKRRAATRPATTSSTAMAARQRTTVAKMIDMTQWHDDAVQVRRQGWSAASTALSGSATPRTFPRRSSLTGSPLAAAPASRRSGSIGCGLTAKDLPHGRVP